MLIDQGQYMTSYVVPYWTRHMHPGIWRQFDPIETIRNGISNSLLRRAGVLGSMGPGTKLPSLGHTSYDYLKQTFALQAEGLIDGGADAY